MKKFWVVLSVSAALLSVPAFAEPKVEKVEGQGAASEPVKREWGWGIKVFRFNEAGAKESSQEEAIKAAKNEVKAACDDLGGRLDKSFESRRPTVRCFRENLPGHDALIIPMPYPQQAIVFTHWSCEAKFRSVKCTVGDADERKSTASVSEAKKPAEPAPAPTPTPTESAYLGNEGELPSTAGRAN